MAQFSILGSLFANALLVLGLTIAAGATLGQGRRMRFQKRLPNDTATLLLLSVFLIAILGLSDQVGDKASEHQVAISVVGADLPARRLRRLALRLSPRRPAGRAAAGEPDARRPAVPVCDRPSCGCRRLAALVSDWFVAAIDPAVEKLGISKAFTGLVIVAIAGNAVENVVACSSRARGKSDLAALGRQELGRADRELPLPALVLVSLLFTEQLTFVIDPVYVGALALTGDRHVADHR